MMKIEIEDEKYVGIKIELIYRPLAKTTKYKNKNKCKMQDKILG